MKKLELKEEMKIAMVIDDYKLNVKEQWWKKSLDKVPWIEENYDLVKEDMAPGVSKDTTSCIRIYKLKKSN